MTFRDNKEYIEFKTPKNFIIFLATINTCILLIYFFIDLEYSTISLYIYGKNIGLSIFFFIPTLFLLVNSLTIDFKNLLNIGSIPAKFLKLFSRVFSTFIIALNGVIFKASINFFYHSKSILFNKFNILLERTSSEEQFFGYVVSKYSKFKKEQYYDVNLSLNDLEKNQWYLEWLSLSDNKFLEINNFLESKFNTYYYYKSTTVLSRFFNGIADFINNTPYLKTFLDQKYIWISGIVIALVYYTITGKIDKLWEKIVNLVTFGDSLAEKNFKLLRSQHEIILNNIARLTNLEHAIEPLQGFFERQIGLNNSIEEAFQGQKYENSLLMYLIKRSLELSTLLTYSSVNGINLPRDNQIHIVFYINKLMKEVFIDRSQGDPVAYVDNNSGNIPIICHALDTLLEQFKQKISSESRHPINFDQLLDR